MASSSHDIGFKRATLILFNVPYWKCKEGESLTTWWARIALPEELRTSVDDDDFDIIDFVFSERRIEGLSAEDLPKAHHIRGYLLQRAIRSESPRRNEHTGTQQSKRARHTTLRGTPLVYVPLWTSGLPEDSCVLNANGCTRFWRPCPRNQCNV